MKYRKHEAREYARSMLKGVWTALPTNTSFIADNKLDEKATVANLDHCLTDLQLEGHYCIGNVAGFWAMTNEERMRVHEINVEVTKGRVPMAEQKDWMELPGMYGGPERPPCTELTAEQKAQMKADLEATGLLEKARAGRVQAQRRVV